MKKILIITSLCLANVLFAQSDFKCISGSSIPDNLLASFDEFYLGPEDNRPYVFKIYYCQINRDDGTNDHLKTETDFLDATAMLNKLFNQYNIFFKYSGFDHIDNTYFYDFDLEENPNILVDIMDYAADNNYYIEKSVNVFALNFLGDGIGGAGGGVGANDPFMKVKILSSLLNHEALAHEVGHFFGLKHTFGNYGPDDVNTPRCLRTRN